MRVSLPVTVLVSAVVSAATYFFMQVVVAPRLPIAEAEVPALSGLAPDQARTVRGPRGLLLLLDGERSDDRMLPGTLTGQLPLAGSRVRRGGEVHAFLATAAAAPLVPETSGLPIEAARQALAAAHLKTGQVTGAPSEAVAKGLVVGSTPAAGSKLVVDAPVDLAVSTGPAAAAVPSVVGKRPSRARELLEAAGLGAGATRYGSNDDYDQGVVIGQSPAAGVTAPRGSKVDLVVND